MFTRNGIVYGGGPDQPIRPKLVKGLSDMLLIRISNGELRLFDATVMEGPVSEPPHDKQVFFSTGDGSWRDFMEDRRDRLRSGIYVQHGREHSMVG